MSISIKLGKVSDEKTKLTKTITAQTSFDCRLKDMTSVTNPTVKIATTANLSAYNYAQISSFGRYYFIVDVRPYPNGIWELDLKCDVLMSYENSIKTCSGLVRRSASDSTLWIPDGSRYISQQASIAQLDGTFTPLTSGNEQSFVLLTTGNGT